MSRVGRCPAARRTDLVGHRPPVAAL